MKYLNRLKAHVAAQNFPNAPGKQPPKLTEPLAPPPHPVHSGLLEGGSVGFVGSPSEAPRITHAILVARCESEDAPDTERAPIIEHDAGVPREWADGYARLLAQRPPKGVSGDRWQVFLDDCGGFLAQWAAEAVRLGWQPHDLFGVCRSKPTVRVDRAGLLWLLNGRRLVELSSDAAVILTASGALQRFVGRSVAVGQVVAWELGRGLISTKL